MHEIAESQQEAARLQDEVDAKFLIWEIERILSTQQEGGQ